VTTIIYGLDLLPLLALLVSFREVKWEGEGEEEGKHNPKE
jgi:hypothetical protein